MDLNYSEDDLSFRGEVREFLATKLPARIADKVRQQLRLTKDDMVEWHALLNDRGWLAANWPKEHNGAAWSAVQRNIFEEESCKAGAPRTVPFGVGMLAPVLMAFGSKQQCEHYLPRILDGTDWWCQGYSEPGAGSDLASLKTSAVREGDHYIINGQKTWTTLGQHADWIFCLVRTSNEGKPQQGISFLLIDMATPGIDVRPIILLDGEHEVNEIFFDNVKVPVGNLVGEENQGWTYAKYLLTHERTGTAGIGFSTEGLQQLKTHRKSAKEIGPPTVTRPSFCRQNGKNRDRSGSFAHHQSSRFARCDEWRCIPYRFLDDESQRHSYSSGDQ